MKRQYTNIIFSHFSEHQQMVMLSGARQVGKTTLSQNIGLDQLRTQFPLLILGEIHKYAKWKQLVKGFYDKYKG